MMDSPLPVLMEATLHTRLGWGHSGDGEVSAKRACIWTDKIYTSKGNVMWSLKAIHPFIHSFSRY